MGRRERKIEFMRLTDIPLATLVAHMADPRVVRHLPLLKTIFDLTAAKAFVAAKEACWRRDGLGHWAINVDGDYVGWGGFQKEGDDWDYGLVLTADAFGLGVPITKAALNVARTDNRIPHVTFLLPPSRKHFSALARAGARYVGEVTHDGAVFRKYRLETA